jgi:hypothetical protein
MMHARLAPLAPLALAPAALALAAVVAAGTTGCGPTDEARQAFEDGGPVPARRGTLVVDSCPMDQFQREILDAAATRAVISEVVLLCLTAHEDGTVGPLDPDVAADLRARSGELRALGYKVSLGLSVGEAPLVLALSARTEALLDDEGWRSSVVAGTAAWATSVDGFDVALPPLSSASRSGVTALVSALDAAVRPQTALGVFIPPSVEAPSDIPGADAYDVPALGAHADRLRVMTLDYACCDGAPGPSIEPGWAVDAVRFARGRAAGAALDISMPLFGTDFGPLGARSVTFLEAAALAAYHGSSVERGPTRAPHFAYTSAAGQQHDLWYDDTFSTSLTLRAWDHETLPPDVGVLFYGLGAEDPALWRSLAGVDR